MSTEAGLSVVLPPGWSIIPLGDAGERRRAVDLLVGRLGLDDGQGAVVRRQLRDRLLATAADAARAGSVTYALSSGGPGGVPIPASLVVTPIRGAAAPELDEPWLALGGGRLDTASVPAGPVVRRVARQEARVDDDADPLPVVKVDYWISAQSGALVHLAASTPLVDHEEAMVGLFDAIVESARWT